MLYLEGYNLEYCYDKDCNLCIKRWECIHYTPIEEYPLLEEYRTYTPLDDSSGELILSVTKKISRLGYPEREILKLVKAWYSCGYRVKDLLTLISRGYHPLEIEKYVVEMLKHEFREYITELVEHGVETLDEVEIPDDLDPSHPYWNDFLAQLRVRKFTGEVRLGPPEEEEPQEECPPEINETIRLALRLAKSVKYAKTGKHAYLFSQKCKELLSQLPPDWAEVVKYQLKKAWEERKSSHAKK